MIASYMCLKESDKSKRVGRVEGCMWAARSGTIVRMKAFPVIYSHARRTQESLYHWCSSESSQDKRRPVLSELNVQYVEVSHLLLLALIRL